MRKGPVCARLILALLICAMSTLAFGQAAGDSNQQPAGPDRDGDSAETAERLDRLDEQVETIKDSVEAVLGDRVKLREEFSGFRADQKDQFDRFAGVLWRVLGLVAGFVGLIIVLLGIILPRNQRIDSRETRDDLKERIGELVTAGLQEVRGNMESLERSVREYRHPETIKRELREEIEGVYAPATDILEKFNSRYDRPEAIRTELMDDVSRELETLRASLTQQIMALQRAHTDMNSRFEERITLGAIKLMTVLLQHDEWPKEYRDQLIRELGMLTGGKLGSSDGREQDESSRNSKVGPADVGQ